MTASVNTTIADGIATVTMNRPEKRNAFDDQVVHELDQTFAALDADDSVRVVVLTGAGSAFSSGADLEWMRSIVELDQQENERDARRLADMLARLDSLGKPTVARVNGHAFGGGVGLICCCDIAIAARRAKFSFSEVRLGLVPAVISPFVVAAIGARQTRRLFLTAEVFTADRARTLGLVHETVEPDALDAAIDELCDQLLQAGPLAQNAAKTLLRELRALPARDVAQHTAETIARVRVSDEGQEGLNAFLNKRKPDWTRH